MLAQQPAAAIAKDLCCPATLLLVACGLLKHRAKLTTLLLVMSAATVATQRANIGGWAKVCRLSPDVLGKAAAHTHIPPYQAVTGIRAPYTSVEGCIVHV